MLPLGVADALRCGKELIHEFRTVLPDKSVRWIYDRSRVVRAKDGSPQCLIGACMDTTDRKEAEDQKTVLIDELKHRVKNTLAVVQSLVRTTLRGAKDCAQFEENFRGRLAALGTGHALLSGESADLREVLASQTGAYATAGAIEFAGPEVAVTPKQAASLGLIGHELMTNAVKYGALSRDGGKVIASWRLEDGLCRISWKETGGPRPKPQAGSGFGSRLIEMMASDLGGTVEVQYAPPGIVMDLSFPVDPEGHQAAPRGPAA